MVKKKKATALEHLKIGIHASYLCFSSACRGFEAAETCFAAPTQRRCIEAGTFGSEHRKVTFEKQTENSLVET